MKQDDKHTGWLFKVGRKLSEESPHVSFDVEKGWDELLDRLPSKPKETLWNRIFSRFVASLLLIPALFCNPDSLWRRIDAAFGMNASCSKARHYFPYAAWGAAILILCAFLFPLLNDTLDKGTLMDKEHQQLVAGISGSAESDPVCGRAMTASGKNETLSKNSPKMRPVATKETLESATTDDIEKLSTPLVSDSSDQGETSKEIVSRDKSDISRTEHDNAKKKGKIMPPRMTVPYSDNSSDRQNEAASRQSRPLSLGVAVGIGGMSSNNAFSEMDMMPNDTDPNSNGNGGGSNDDGDSQTGASDNSHDRNIYQDDVLRHNLPVVLGLRVNYRIGRRVSLQSGLRYSFLYSKGEKKDQRLHMLGIPLDVKYDFYESRQWKIFAGAGLAADWTVYGTYGGVKIDSHPVWLSLRIKGGVSFMFSEKLGIYMEPTVSYFLSNGSVIENYYTEHPLNIGLSLGLSYHL